jgi:hypothetical protein
MQMACVQWTVDTRAQRRRPAGAVDDECHVQNAFNCVGVWPAESITRHVYEILARLQKLKCEVVLNATYT